MASKEKRKVYVVSFDGCLRDGNPSVISIIQREREENMSVFIVQADPEDREIQLAATLHGWGLSFCFYNTDPTLVLKVMNSQFDCELVRWDSVEDVMLSTFRSVCKALANQSTGKDDAFTCIHASIAVLSRTLETAPIFENLLEMGTLVESVLQMEFALERFKYAFGIDEKVAMSRDAFVRKYREVLRDETTPAEET